MDLSISGKQSRRQPASANVALRSGRLTGEDAALGASEGNGQIRPPILPASRPLSVAGGHGFAVVSHLSDFTPTEGYAEYGLEFTGVGSAHPYATVRLPKFPPQLKELCGRQPTFFNLIEMVLIFFNYANAAVQNVKNGAFIQSILLMKMREMLKTEGLTNCALLTRVPDHVFEDLQAKYIEWLESLDQGAAASGTTSISESTAEPQNAQAAPATRSSNSGSGGGDVSIPFCLPFQP